MGSIERLFQWCKGYFVCKIEGSGFGRFINVCNYNHIKFWNMKCYTDGCICCISLGDFWKIRHYIKKTNIEVRLLRGYGFAVLIALLMNRRGLYIGVVLSIAIVYLLSVRIWKIEVSGNSYYTKERLEKYLHESHQIRPGTLKRRIDCYKLEESIRLDFPDISWISIRKQGTSLIIDLEEMVKYESHTKNQTMTKYICSKEDGVIVSMVTRSGKPLVKVGDHVKKGQILIKGIVELVDDSMEVVKTIDVNADGDICAEVCLTYEKIYHLNTECKYYQPGVKQWIFSLGCYSFRIGNVKKIISGHENYNRITHIKYYWPGFYIQTESYRPYKNAGLLYNVQQVAKAAQELFLKNINELEQKGIQIIENNVKIDKYEDRVEVKGPLVIIEPIGTETNAFPESFVNEKIGDTP